MLCRRPRVSLFFFFFFFFLVMLLLFFFSFLPPPQSATEEDIARVSQTFVEVQKTVDAKQLKPMVRTQYMRTAFQIPFDPTVRIRWVGCEEWGRQGGAGATLAEWWPGREGRWRRRGQAPSGPVLLCGWAPSSWLQTDSCRPTARATPSSLCP